MREKELLLQACRAKPPNLEPLLSQPLDWKWLISQAALNGVTPMFFRALQDYPAIPQSARDELLDTSTKNIAQSLLLTSGLLQIVDLLQRQGLPVLAYKGPALAKLAYGDVTMRCFGDLDILARPQDLAAAKSALEAGGYRCSLSGEEAAYFRDERYHLHFRGGDPPLNIELHWAITRAYWPFPLDAKRLWNGASTVELLGTAVATLDAELTLLTICAHGAKERWPRLSLICDLAWLLERTPNLDWRWIEQEAESMGRTRVLLLGLLLGSSLLHAPVPKLLLAQALSDETVRTVAEEIAEHIFSGDIPGGLRYHRYAWRIWNRGQDRAGYLQHAIRELPGNMRRLFQPSDADGRLPAGLSWVWRPVRVALQHRSLPRILRRIGDHL